MINPFLLFGGRALFQRPAIRPASLFYIRRPISRPAATPVTTIGLIVFGLQLSDKISCSRQRSAAPSAVHVGFRFAVQGLEPGALGFWINDPNH